MALFLSQSLQSGFWAGYILLKIHLNKMAIYCKSTEHNADRIEMVKISWESNYFDLQVNWMFVLFFLIHNFGIAGFDF